MTDELTQEIIDWYEKRGKYWSEMTSPSRMPTRITREQVEVAAIRFYNNIQSDDFVARILTMEKCQYYPNGKKLNYIDIVWEVWGLAKAVQAEEYAEGQKKLLGAHKIIQDMERNHRDYAETAEKIIKELNSEVEEVHKSLREQWALVVGLWLWLFWEINRALGG